MPNFFVISDPHFGHANILKFKSPHGGPLRSFKSVEEMDEAIVDNWNKTVKAGDHVYCLGDVCMRNEHLKIIKRLNGRKRLIMGNHDIFEVQCYLKAGFKKVMAYRVLDGFVLSHIPIHAGSLGRFKRNIHGHLHADRVKKENGCTDNRYFSACVELNNYTPIALEDIKKSIV